MKIPAQDVKKIAVLRALQLGDLLCSIPALRALRKAFPDAHISLIGLPGAKSLVERFNTYFDSLIVFPGYPGLPEQPVDPATVISFISKMQQENYDLILQMQGNGTIVNSLVALMGAKYAAGFCMKHDYCPDTRFFLEYPGGIHEIERHLALMDFLGIPLQGSELEFPLTSHDEEQFRQLKLPINEMRYVCIHPGSRGSWRQWPPAYFAALGDYCSEEGMAVVITGTPGELPIVDEVKNAMKTKAIIAAGKTSLGAVGVLIKNAFALISNCTGVSHMAAAFKTPSIVISMDGEPERWGPLDGTLHHTIDWTRHPDFDRVFQATAGLFYR